MRNEPLRGNAVIALNTELIERDEVGEDGDSSNTHTQILKTTLGLKPFKPVTQWYTRTHTHTHVHTPEHQGTRQTLSFNYPQTGEAVAGGGGIRITSGRMTYPD